MGDVGSVSDMASALKMGKDGLAAGVTVRRIPPSPPPPGASAYSSAPSGQRGFIGRSGTSGLFTEDQLVPDPHPYWEAWFTQPHKKGAGFSDWVEKGPIRTDKNEIIGGGIPRIVVLPNPEDTTNYVLHLYLGHTSGTNSDKGHAYLAHYTSSDGEIWKKHYLS